MNKENRHYTATPRNKHFDRDHSYQAERNKLKAFQISEYLKSVHKIKIPENFFVQLLTAHLESYGSSLNIPLYTIDAIVDACGLFEEYVLDISQLVCTEIITMVRTHICVISTHTLAKSTIPLKEDLPVNFRATVQKNGSITVTDKHS